MSKKEEASLSTFIQTANEMEISERLTLYNRLADDIIAASAGQLKTKESDFLRTLPYLIIGAFDAKNIPYTTMNIQDAFKLIIDDVVIGYNLHPVEYSDEEEGAWADTTEILSSFSLKPQVFSQQNADKIADKIRALFSQAKSGEMNTQDRVNQAGTGALRSDLRLAKDMSDADVLHEVHRVLARAVGQIIDASFPEATQKLDHPIWDDVLLSCIIRQIEETALEASLEIIKNRRITA
jgi:hypothetical protein